MFAHFAALALSLTLLGAPAPAPKAETPEAVVKDFYAFHIKHDMGFTEATAKARKAWLSDGLWKAIQKYFKTPSKDDEVPGIDGDPFTDSQDPPTQFEVGNTEMKDPFAYVSVTLSGNGDKRVVKVKLQKSTAGWKIDDVTWSTGESFKALLSK
jgi:hypothetical protein